MDESSLAVPTAEGAAVFERAAREAELLHALAQANKEIAMLRTELLCARQSEALSSALAGYAIKLAEISQRSEARAVRIGLCDDTQSTAPASAQKE